MLRHYFEFILQIVMNIVAIVDLVIYHTLVCFSNAKKLCTFLVRGTRTWIIMLGRLVIFTCVLGIGWYRLIKYWVFSPLILRNVEYGQGGKFRNLMDIYLPVPHNPSVNSNKSIPEAETGAPVVIFVSGGAWIIGYKMWSALVARGLSYLGIVTIVPDYRNFPQGDIEDMMFDIRAAVQWTRYNASKFGGDSNKIVLAGQSAGAHICTCLMVDDFLRSKNNKQYFTSSSKCSGGGLAEATTTASQQSTSPKVVSTPDAVMDGLDDNSVTENNRELSDSDLSGSKQSKSNSNKSEREHVTALHVEIPISAVTADPAINTDTTEESSPTTHFNASEHIKLFIGVSGPYNLYALVAHLQQRGLDASIIEYICKNDIVRYSPTIQLNEYCAAASDASKARAANQQARDLQDSIATLLLLQESEDAAHRGGSVVDGEEVRGVVSPTAASEDADGVYVDYHSLNDSPPTVKDTVGSSAAASGLVQSNLDNLLKKSLTVEAPNRPFYAYYLPNVHSFLSAADEVEHYNTLTNTSNTPLPSVHDPAEHKSAPTGNQTQPSLSRPVSPMKAQHQAANKHLSDFPPVVLFHGSSDKSIPVSICTDLFDTLLRNGAAVDLKIYNHWSHTDAILEAPLSGNMRLFHDMVDVIETHTNTSLLESHREEVSTIGGCSDVIASPVRPRKDSDWFDDSASGAKDRTTSGSSKVNNGGGNNRKKLEPFVPRVLVNIARSINPF